MPISHQMHERHIRLMHTTCDILGNIVKDMTQETATSYHDGGNGWTVLEVLGHLRDFDGFFRQRAQMMIEQQHPDLPAYDHEALAIERDYNRQKLQQVYAELVESRGKTAAFFENLTDNQWECTSIHPERGYFTMTDAVMQVGLHEVGHIEQITRILLEKR